MSANCPGFRPHSVRATRCRRCFRDYSEHKPEQLGSVTDVSGGFSRINKTTSVSSNVGGGLGESTKRGSYSSGLDRVTEIPKSVKEVTVDATISLPRRRKSDTNSEDTSSSDRTPSETKANDEKKPESKPTSTGKPPVSASKPPLPADTVVRPRTRSRPLSSVASMDEDSSSATERRRRPNSWASDASDSEAEGGSSTVTGRRRRTLRSASMSDGNESDSSVSSSRVRRVQILAAKEVERKQPDLGDRSQELTSPDVEFILRVKTSAANMKEENDETDSVAATETTEATETTLTCPDNMVEDLQNQVASLKSDLESAQLKCTKLEAEKVKLEKEKKDIIEKRKVSARDKEALEKTASEVLKLKTKVNELQTNKEDLTDENKVLKLEVKELQAEVDKRETPEKVKSELNTVKNKLSQAETLCEELMEENEELKKEMKEMEEELEELHDNFREDQANEYLDLKKELETTTKNCRVLQFKLRKTERRCEQLESEKSMLDEKVKDLQATGKIDADKTKMKELEVEVNVAKEVSLKMHSELESLKETVRKAEGENERLRQQLMNLPAGEKNNHVIPSAVELPSLTKDASGKSYEAVVRDLYDTMERETDMREQLRFAEDEIKTMRRKLSSLEQENETVVMQLKKMANSRSKGGSAKKDEDELSPEELKLQFELCEQEMFVLRKRVDELEHENESLNSEVKYLQDKLVNQPLTTVELPELPPSEKTGPTVYYEQKIKLLEFEARELRRKLVEKERENERLQTEVEVHRRKASKVMVRSRSLDSEFQVDLKRQLQLVEQEATILRQKTMDLETENDKLQNENKRFQLRLSRKPPPGPADLMQLENMELKDKVTELNRKLNTLKDELVNAAGGQVISATVLQEYKPKKETSSGGGTSGGSGTSDMENQLIAGLKKTVKAKDDEVVTLQAKITQIEVENSKLNRDYKKLKDTLNYKKRPMRPVRETATRMELKELIKDLEDEVSDLQVTVRGREIVQENLREELEKTKAQLDSTQKDFAQKEEKLTSELNDLRKQTETLRNEAKNEKLKAASWESQVKRLAEAQGTDLNLLEKAQSFQTEKDAMQKRIKEIEGKLKKEQEKVKDTEDKLKAVTSMKDELTKGSKILETQKKELEDALQEKKSQFNKAQEQIKNLKKKMDEKEKDFTAKFKEYSEIKNELEDERSKLKKHDNRQSEVAVGWLKEREELKKVLADIRAKAESLQVQMGTQETQWKEKEAKLKEEHAKKLEKSVKEARQQMEADVKQATNEEKAQKAKVADLTDQLDKLEKSLKESQEKVRHLNNQHRKDRDEWQTSETDLENKLRAETKKRERMEKESDQEKRTKDQEIIALKDKIFQLEREQRRASNKLDDIVSANESRIKELERDLDQERQEYDEMTNKYEVLEEEFLSVKSRLVTEKEQVQANFGTIKRDYEAALAELKSLRDSFNVRQDNWIKERLDLNDTIKKMQIKIDRLADVEQDKLRLKDTVTEKNKVIESYKKEERHLRDERDKLKKSVDELKKRCTELERLEKASRAKVEVAKEAQDLKNKLGHNETTHKGELATMRVEYEGRIRMMSQEMQSMQSQIAELARDREVLIAKLEEADDMVEQIKNSSLKRERVRGREEVDVVRRKAEDLQRQLQNVMERYEAAELESKRLRVQLEAEKNNYQVQIGDLKSKINQYEEKNMLDSTRGSTRGYTKTRLELAWDKERTDQQKLLQDTQVLVNELKDKVMTIETLRDKEKQEARKQIIDLNDLLEMEEQANKRKWNETQAQMTELKESHSKLRDQNNRLRQEREIMEQEREEWRDRLINTEDMQIKVTDLMEEVKKMASLVTLPAPPKIGLETAPDLLMGERSAVKPPRRNSRANEELREALEKIKKRTEELQKVSTNTGENALGRSASFRRAISASEVNAPRTVRRNSGDPGQRWMNPQRITNYPIAPPSMILRPPPRSKSLYRKSLSLDQQLHTDMAGKIWDSGDESLNNTPYGSELSLRSRIRGQFLSPTGYESDGSVGDVSLDSRMSRMTGLSVKSRPLQSRTGSREGSVLSSADESSPSAPQVKQKKTLREKLKLTSKKKTNGVEDSRTGGLVAQVGLATLGLGDVLNVKPEKDDKADTVSIRSRISKALKKPLSRSSSADRAGSDRDIRKMKEEDLSAVKSALEKTESSKEAKESKLSAKGEKGSKKSLLGRLGGSSSGSTKELKAPKSSAPDDPVPPPIVRREEAPTAGDRMRSAGVIRQRTTVIEPRKY